MQFGKTRRDEHVAVVAIENHEVFTVDTARDPEVGSLAELLTRPDPVTLAVLGACAIVCTAAAMRLFRWN